MVNENMKIKYGMTQNDIDATRLVLENRKHYAENRYIIRNGRKVTMAEISRRLIENPLNYFKDISYRLKSFEEFAAARDLCEIILVVTSKNHNDSIKNILKNFTDTIKNIRSTNAWKNIDKHAKGYIHIREPHEDGKPHLNLAIWIPKKNVEAFLQMLQSKYEGREIEIMTSFVPKSYTRKKDPKRERYQKIGLPGSVVQTDKSLISYVTKNIEKVVAEIENPDKLSFLTAWYILHDIRLFGSTQTFSPIDAYYRVKKLFTLNRFTELVDENIIQIWKNKTIVYMITVNGTEILWKKHNSKIYSFSDACAANIAKKDINDSFVSANISEENIIIEGKFLRKIKQNGIIVYEIEKYNDTVDIPDINTNNQLSEECKDKILKSIKEVMKVKMYKLKKSEKIFITPEYLDENYEIKIESQKNFRNRLVDHLPYHQIVKGGKITYKVSEIEAWMESYSSINKREKGVHS